MSRLIDTSGLLEDAFTHLADDEAPVGVRDVTVSLARWKAETEVWLAHDGRVGIRLPNDIAISDDDRALVDRPLLVLQFPKFADGRAYSQARTLRQQLAFKGELRAVGEAVVVDQIQGLHRCGFDSFELRDDQDPNLALRRLRSETAVYQPAIQDPGPVVRNLRRDRAPA